jgi:hypothetical protein
MQQIPRLGFDPRPPATNFAVHGFIFSTILMGDMGTGRDVGAELSYPLGTLGYRSAVKTDIRKSGLHGPDPPL